jgi:hypothetical protein
LKRPSFQFYPADWRKDANLRRCSPAARGIWMDVLCVLHDSDSYGIVRWPLKELASAAGAPVAYLKELSDKRVLKGCDRGECEPLIFTPRHGRKLGDPVTLVEATIGPIWYSARFVRDEYLRAIRGETSRFGACNGNAPKASPIPPIGDGPSSSSASSASAYSVASATGGDPPSMVVDKTELTRQELWRAGKALLAEQGMAKAQCGTFVGKLVQDYGEAIVVEAVRSTVVAQPADAAPYLRAACMRLKGERKDPVTVTENPRIEATARLMHDLEAAKANMKPPPTSILAMVGKAKTA